MAKFGTSLVSVFEVVAGTRSSGVVARWGEPVNGLFESCGFELGDGLTRVAEVAVVDRLEVRFVVLTDPLVEGASAVGVLTGLKPRDEIRLLGVLVDGGGRRRGDEVDDGTTPRDTRLERGVEVPEAAVASTG